MQQGWAPYCHNEMNWFWQSSGGTDKKVIIMQRRFLIERDTESMIFFSGDRYRPTVSSIFHCSTLFSAVQAAAHGNSSNVDRMEQVRIPALAVQSTGEGDHWRSFAVHASAERDESPLAVDPAAEWNGASFTVNPTAERNQRSFPVQSTAERDGSRGEASFRQRLLPIKI